MLIKKLREAIALGKKRGIDTTTWEQKIERLLQAQEVGKRTRELLDTTGWCLWECHAMGREVMVIIRDELVTSYPQEYPAYTEAELVLLSDMSEATELLVHEAKKITQAFVEGITWNSRHVT